MATSTIDLKALYTDVIPKTKFKIQGDDIMKTPTMGKGRGRGKPKPRPRPSR
jgi:hypothetical protein